MFKYLRMRGIASGTTVARTKKTGFLRSCNSGPEAIPRMREYKRAVKRNYGI